jgi:C4-dicarboxylate transporter DctM subunit
MFWYDNKKGDNLMTIAILTTVLIVTIALGMPIAFCLGFAAVVAFFFMDPILMNVIAQKMFTGLDSFPLMAIPFFIFAGELMGRGGITKRLLLFADMVVGRVCGGLGLANVLASMIFGGITGSAIADVSALGSVEIPMMVEAGYDPDFSAGITCASACIGPIIPPSIPMVIYATAVGASIGGLFLAGYLPGILIGFTLMITAYFISIKRKYPVRKRKISFKGYIIGFKDAISALIMPLIIMGGILGGIFTPTEAASVAVAYTFILTVFIYKEVKLSDLPDILKNTAVTTAVVLILVSTSNVFAWIIMMEQVAVKLGGLFGSMDKYVFLLFVNLILLFVGTFMDNCPAILILAPILTPIALSLGIHPLHFGIIFVVNMVIGLITPPLGQVLFVAVPIAKISFERVTKGTFPFLIVEIITLLIITYVPFLTLYLPKLLGYA